MCCMDDVENDEKQHQREEISSASDAKEPLNGLETQEREKCGRLEIFNL